MSSCKVCRKTRHNKSASTFFRFPKDANRCQLWALKCNLLDDFHLRGSEYFYKSFRICSDHFASTAISWNGKKKSLLLSAVPEIALHSPRKSKLTHSAGWDTQRDQEINNLLVDVCDDSEFRLQMVDHICRLCGEERPSLTGIFGQRGQNLGLPDQIKFIPIKICENDVMPSKVCQICIKRIQDNFNFFTRCLESDEKIRIMLDMKDQETTYDVDLFLN